MTNAARYTRAAPTDKGIQMKDQKDKPANRDSKRDKWGVKAQRRNARRAKDKRRNFEASGRWK